MPHPLCLLLIACLTGAAVAGDDETALVNQLRAQAGLPTLQRDATLDAAAARHAAYLDRHRAPGQGSHGVSAHVQQPDLADFSGETPGERALAAGYSHREVLENVSMGYDDAPEAIDGLMSAIYHRLTFLDLEADQIGAASGERSRVFLLGRSDIGALCAVPPAAALYRTPVDCMGRLMTREHYDELCEALPAQALFKPSHPISCPNGVLLDAAYMQQVCVRPPPAARFRGHGRYFAACENGTRLDADWFSSLCERQPADAVYGGSGSYYEICDPPVRVEAAWLDAHCAALPDAALYSDSWRYRRPCADALDLRAEFLDALDHARRDGLPEVVMWPPAGATGVTPAFFIEEPDPLPDLDVAGFPVSIQFNPSAVGKVELKDFRLFLLDGGARMAVRDTRLLDKASDPHGLLTAFEFALFPLDRLAWGARYQAVVDVLLDGEPRHYAWSFETREVGTPVLTVSREGQRFEVRSGVDYLLYLPPQQGRPHTVLTTRTEHLRGNRVNLEVVDPNTLRVRVDARYCDRIRMQFDGGHSVELVPTGCAG